MPKIYNWGIIGPGHIARKFAQDLQYLTNAKLWAVASRSLERAQAFATEFGATHAYGSYEALVECPDLDVVYIATPHTGHLTHSLLCLNHRIPVLCEKPLAVNSTQVSEIIDAAATNQTFLMEALWTRFLPTTLKVLELIESDTIGAVQSIKADFGFNANYNPSHRLFNPALAGGSLLDIGIYPIFLSMLLLGKPASIKAQGRIGLSGVDVDCGMVFQYAGGQLAHLHSTFLARTKTEAFIYGEKGVIHMHTRWHEPTSISVWLYDNRPVDYDFGIQTNGYSYEAEEVMHCLAANKTQSESFSWEDSKTLMGILDAVRKEIGLVYAGID